MKCLVLGSSGQVGTSLVKMIEKMGHEALGFDLENSINQDLRISKNKILIDSVRESDFVFFLAFDVGGSMYLKSYQNTFDFISNNIKLMENTFEVLKETKKPFIFTSSQMSNMLYSPYGLLKAVGELYTKSLNGLIVKFWNIYGIEHDFSKSHVITDFIIKAKKNGKIEILTDGSEQRQFLFADDCSECLITLAGKYDEISREENLHITSFKWNSILDVAKIVADLHKGIEVKAGNSVDVIQKDKRNEPDPFILKYWKPKTSLFDGIKLIKDAIKV